MLSIATAVRSAQMRTSFFFFFFFFFWFEVDGGCDPDSRDVATSPCKR